MIRLLVVPDTFAPLKFRSASQTGSSDWKSPLVAVGSYRMDETNWIIKILIGTCATILALQMFR